MAIKSSVSAINGVPIPTVAAALYTVSANIDRVLVTNARIVNHTAGKKTVNLWVLQDGETAADQYKALVSKQLAGNETYLLPELRGQAIEANGSIEADCDVATSCSLTVDVTEYTS